MWSIVGLMSWALMPNEEKPMDVKELYIAAHEALIEEYMEAHPNASEADAYDATADAAFDRMQHTFTRSF
jgi:hypothetical protein